MNEGADVTVDNSNQLHIFANIYSASSNHNDSLDYIYAYTPEKYSCKGVPNGYMTLWDIRTLTNGYGIIKIDSVQTEGPSGILTAPGYTTCAWDDGSGGKLSTNARLQISRSYDGTKLFYSWTESDATIVGSNWNIFPDITMKGYDLTTNKVSGRTNVTSSVVNADQEAFFHYMAPVVKNIASGWQIPMVCSTGNILSAASPLKNYFLSGVNVAGTSFSINAMSGSCTTTTDIKKNTPGISASIYPNPASHTLHIESEQYFEAGTEIEIINTLGQTVLKQQFRNEIDISKLSTGCYILKITNPANHQFQASFIKHD